MKTDQYLSDKIKAARQSLDGTGWLTFKNQRYLIATGEDAIDKVLEENKYKRSVFAFVRCKRGIALEQVHRHDSGRIRTTNARYMNDSDVMAVVLETHPRDQE